ncbi:MAG: hypothetical protein HY262_02885, partial [Chloroflexi bacterium]|nr:hypothetical protein [Chloroflexota bacterium]
MRAHRAGRSCGCRDGERYQRFVVWRWAQSPLGPASALGRLDAEGRLTLYTATPAYADLLGVWHLVHDVKCGEVRIAL